MPRKDGNKESKDLLKKIELTKKNIKNKQELMEEFSQNLTVEEQNRATSKLNNKERALNHMKGSFKQLNRMK